MFFALGLGLAAAVFSYWGVARFLLWAKRRKLLDLPNERSSHTRPTPRGGGLVIVAVTLLFGTVLAGMQSSPSSWAAWLPFAAGALIVAAVSWFDDLSSLPSWIRLTVHFSGAIIAIAGYGFWGTIALPVVGSVNLGWWGAAVTAMWIVGLTNAYNFMDGTDGIAGSQAVIAGLGWALIGWAAGIPLVGGLGFLVAGASLGFLVHNWPPAHLFMGDIGSAFLGYALAVLPVMYGFFDKNGTGAPAVGLLLVWPFVFDTSFTFVRRLCRGENVFSAHRSHLYQRMSTAHSGHARVAVIYSGLALVGGVLAQVWLTRVAQGAVSIVLVLPVLCVGLWLLVAIQERRQAVDSGSRVAAIGRV